MRCWRVGEWVRVRCLGGRDDVTDDTVSHSANVRIEQVDGPGPMDTIWISSDASAVHRVPAMQFGNTRIESCMSSFRAISRQALESCVV